MRARYPDGEGFVERDGVRSFYEIYGTGAPTILFLPAWALVHSRAWKAQIPYFARHYRAVTFDPRGNGRSDRPPAPAAYVDTKAVEDALAVLDATETDRAILVGFSRGGWLAAMLAALHPDRVMGAVIVCAGSPLGQILAERSVYSFSDPLDTDEGWAKYNRHYWQRDYRGFLEFFASKMFTEPHSTKQIEDVVGWGLETSPEILMKTIDSQGSLLDKLREQPENAVSFYRSIQCPVLIVHGDQDAVVSPTRSIAVADAMGVPVTMIEGGGHDPFCRDPVRMNLLLRAFIERLSPLSSS